MTHFEFFNKITLPSTRQLRDDLKTRQKKGSFKHLRHDMIKARPFSCLNCGLILCT